MMDESLKRLLDAEAQAELVIARAEAERQEIIEQARHEVEASEQQHAMRVKETRATFLAQANQRAQQTIAELKRRHDEHAAALSLSAKDRELQALDTAVSLLTGAGHLKP